MAMTNDSDEPLDPLTEEALKRLAFLHSGKETERDWASYYDWKDASEAQRAAAIEAEDLWERLGPALSPPRKASSKILPVLLAAAILAGGTFATGLFGEPAAYFADYRTSAGERRSVALDDGTTLDIDSRTSFDLAADRRTLTLYQGQVFISVAGDRSRAFTVRAGNGTVRTLGTKFAVRRTDDNVTALVTESAVQVSYTRDQQSSWVDVKAGQAVKYDQAHGLGAPQPADTAALTAWQRGELAFNRSRLADVAAELERYRRGKIVIIGDDVKSLSMTGLFDIDDTDSVLEAAKVALPVTILNLPGLTLIRRDDTRIK